MQSKEFASLLDTFLNCLVGFYESRKTDPHVTTEGRHGRFGVRKKKLSCLMNLNSLLESKLWPTSHGRIVMNLVQYKTINLFFFVNQ